MRGIAFALIIAAGLAIWTWPLIEGIAAVGYAVVAVGSLAAG